MQEGKRLRIQKPSYLNVANLVSLIRLILLPVFFYFLMYYLQWQKGAEVAGVTRVYYLTTIALAAIILLTDWLDGWLARKLETVNPLGAFLDPLADKFFAFFTMALLAWAEILPVWLVLLVFFKEMFILIGWTLLFILNYDTEISPSKIGKAASVCQGVVVCAALLTLPGGEQFSWQAFPLFPLAEILNRTWFHIITALATAVAGGQYILEGLARAERVAPEAAQEGALLEVVVSGKEKGTQTEARSDR
jgi:cardiolipin synthase